MSQFSPTHWVIFFVLVVVPIGYGIYHLIRAYFRFTDWRRERAERGRNPGAKR